MVVLLLPMTEERGETTIVGVEDPEALLMAPISETGGVVGSLWVPGTGIGPEMGCIVVVIESVVGIQGTSR